MSIHPTLPEALAATLGCVATYMYWSRSNDTDGAIDDSHKIDDMVPSDPYSITHNPECWLFCPFRPRIITEGLPFPPGCENEMLGRPGTRTRYLVLNDHGMLVPNKFWNCRDFWSYIKRRMAHTGAMWPSEMIWEEALERARNNGGLFGGDSDWEFKPDPSGRIVDVDAEATFHYILRLAETWKMKEMEQETKRRRARYSSEYVSYKAKLWRCYFRYDENYTGPAKNEDEKDAQLGADTEIYWISLLIQLLHYRRTVPDFVDLCPEFDPDLVVAKLNRKNGEMWRTMGGSDQMLDQMLAERSADEDGGRDEVRNAILKRWFRLNGIRLRIRGLDK